MNVGPHVDLFVVLLETQFHQAWSLLTAVEDEGLLGAKGGKELLLLPTEKD